MQDRNEERTWYTIDRIEDDGRRVYGCGVRTRDRAIAYLNEVMLNSADMADGGYYKLRSLGYCTFEEAWRMANEPQLMPLGRTPAAFAIEEAR